MLERRLDGLIQHLRSGSPAPLGAVLHAASAADIETDVDDIVPLTPRAHTLDDDLPGSAVLGLSPEEIEHFKSAGYVVKRGLIDPELCSTLVDSCWQNAPEPLVREDPRTWVNVGTAWANLPPALTADGKHSYRRLSNPSANSEWRYHGLGFQQDFLDSTSGAANCSSTCVRPQPQAFSVRSHC